MQVAAELEVEVGQFLMQVPAVVELEQLMIQPAALVLLTQAEEEAEVAFQAQAAMEVQVVQA